MNPKTPMDEFFNLAPVENEVLPTVIEKSEAEVFQEVGEIKTAIAVCERLDVALSSIEGLATHDKEMDEIANKAMNTFTDLIHLGGNVADMNAGKIYEAASQMLRMALDAKNSKADKKLRMIELQLKKIRLDNTMPKKDTDNDASVEFDRNELLKYLISTSADK